MKKLFLTFLLSLFVLPAFVPWMPHGAVHALHDHQESHHQSQNQPDTTHEHDQADHDHNTQTHASPHHPINLDVITYFSDYLHVDLQSPNQLVLETPVQDAQDIDFTLAVDALPQNRYELTSVQSRAPPDWQRFRPENTPLYLSTQRLRI